MGTWLGRSFKQGHINRKGTDAGQKEDFRRLSLEAIGAARQHLQASSGITDGETNFFRRQCEVLMVQLNQVFDILVDEKSETDSVSGIKSNSLLLQWPIQASRELYRVLMNVVSLVEACCHDGSCLKAALRQDQRTRAFSEIFKEIVWCTSVVYYHNTFRYFKIPSIELQEFPQPRVTYWEQFVLEKAADDDLQELMAKLQEWNRDHVCSAKVCGNMHEQRDPHHCLAAQMLGRWNKAKLGLVVGDDMSASGEADHLESLLWSFDGEVLKHGPTLGSGSFGSVQEATWLGDKYAKKTFNMAIGPSSLRAEAGALAKLNHPHIVKTYAYSQESETSILMDLMTTDLQKYIKSRMEGGAIQPFSLPAGIDLMLQVADAMRYLHSQKMAHRDLKSPNILVNPLNTSDFDSGGFVLAKIADFGLAKTKREVTSYSHLTHNMGSRLWMAPEVFEANKSDVHLDVAFPMKPDVYSFGIICYEVLSGDMPFQGIRRNELYKQLTSQEPLRPELPANCPGNLASLLKRCWDTDPRRRPEFKDVCKALRYLKGLLMTDLDENKLGDVKLPSGTVFEDLDFQMKMGRMGSLTV